MTLDYIVHTNPEIMEEPFSHTLKYHKAYGGGWEMPAMVKRWLIPPLSKVYPYLFYPLKNTSKPAESKCRGPHHHGITTSL